MAVVVAAVTGGLVWVLRATQDGLSDAASWAQLAGGWVLAVAVAAPPVFRWMRQDSTSPAVSRADLEESQEQLAAVVRAQWLEEIRVRRLEDPQPVAVRWTATARPVVDRFENLPAPPRRVDTTEAGISNLAAWFRALRRRRLVLIGERGFGKTTLAVLLVRHVLATRSPGEPVPVLLTMADWSDESFTAWVTRRLSRDYSFLTPETAHRLVRECRVIPVLDGLDELAAEDRPGKVRSINQAMAGTDAFILTCRTSEYAEAVAGADVLTSTPVLEPEAVDAAAAASYLERRLPPRPGAGWARLLADLRLGPQTALGQGLGSPFVLWLLEATFVEQGRDPTVLLEMTTGQEVSRCLLDELVPALVENNRHVPDDDVAHPFRPLADWETEDVRRWLTFIARHLADLGTYDLGWWNMHLILPDGVRRRWFGTLSALAFATFAGVVAALWLGALGGVLAGAGLWLLMMWQGPIEDETARLPRAATGGLFGNHPIRSLTDHLKSEARGAVGHALRFGTIAGVTAGFAFGWPAGVTVGATAAAADWLIRSISGTGIDLSMVFTVPFALVWGLMFGVAHGLVFGSTLALQYLAVIVAGPGIGLALTLPVLVAVCTWRALPPHRRHGAVRGVFLWAASGGAYMAFQHLGSDPLMAIGTAAALGVGLGLIEGIVSDLTYFMLVRPGPAYLMTVAILRYRSQAPPYPLKFLADCRRIGLLRQVGPVYQFRHSTLQDHLAVR
ncbi:NACHT domain-containing protein [Streptomyces cyaneochromogenes]|nr:NACHT domain-containing protein [Streptomyces cyaneochromogenes]